MTTYIVYADSNDGYIASVSTNYNTARAGGTFSVNTTDTLVRAGQRFNTPNSAYYLYQAFMSFNTAAIVDTDEIVDAQISVYNGYGNNSISVDFGLVLYAKSWTAGGLTTADWSNGTAIQSLTELAVIDLRKATNGARFQRRTAGGRALLTYISKTGNTEVMMTSNRFKLGAAPQANANGIEETQIDSTTGTNRPALYVYTVALSTMNTVGIASTQISDGTHLSVLSNGASAPTLQIGYSNVANSTTWTQIHQLPTTGGSGVYTSDGLQPMAMISGPNDKVYVFYAVASDPTSLLMRRYGRTGGVWSLEAMRSQKLSDEVINSISATYVQGIGANARDSIFVVMGFQAARYTANNRAMRVAIADPNISGTSNTSPSVPLFISSITNPSYLLPRNWPEGTNLVGGRLGSDNIPNFPGRIAVSSYTDTVLDITNGVVTGTGRFSDVGTVAKDGAKVRVIGIDASTFAILQTVTVNAGSYLRLYIVDTSLNTLATYNLADYATIAGPTPYLNYDGWFNSTDRTVVVYYVSTTTAANVVTRLAVAVDTGAMSSTTFTAGTAGTTNTQIRAPRGAVDERRVLVEVANTTAGGVLSTVSVNDVLGNLVPTQPTLGLRQNFDASNAAVFAWTFTDTNRNDTQTAYQLQIDRVSDSANVFDSGKVVSVAQTHTLTAATLANPGSYRWRVRTYDKLDSAGAWSSYGTFATAATGSLTITDPASDNAVGIETASYLVKWTYTSSSPQAQRRVVLTRTSDNVVISDTGFQPSTVAEYLISGMESDREYRVDVMLINAASVQSPTASRLITPSFANPMEPDMVLSTGEAWIEITVTNPDPTGDRPQVDVNEVWRQEAGKIGAVWQRIGFTGYNGIYRDYAVRSGVAYNYFIRGAAN